MNRFRVVQVLLLSLLLPALLPISVAGADPITGSLTASSDQGDFVGQARSYSSSTPLDEFSVLGNAEEVHVRISAANGDSWGLSFYAPKGEPLRPATYIRAARSRFGSPEVPGLDVSLNGRGCNQLTGTFKVGAIKVDSNGKVLGLHVTFEQHCENGAPVLSGELSLGLPGPDSPEPNPVLPVVPDTTAVPAFLNMASDPGDYVGFGGEYGYAASNLDHFTWRTERNSAIVQLIGAAGETWNLRFNSLSGQRIVPGTYGQPNQEAYENLNVSGLGRACSPVGTFHVTHAEYGSDGSLEKFKASFRQHCEGSAGGLRGQVSVGIPAPVPPLALNDPTRSWGFNALGTLGDATTRDRLSAGGVAGPGFFKVSAGGLHSLGLKEDGTVWSWGYNAFGQLGNGTITDSAVPIKVAGLNNVASISAGFFNSLAVKKDGTVWSWGWNAFGQIGDGTLIAALTPVRAGGLENVVEASSGLGHNLALKTDGTVWAWGWNVFGQLGDGTTIDRRTPVPVPGLNYIRHIAAGGLHSLALDSDEKVRSWGSNVLGQLGDETYIDRHRPTTVHYASNVFKISAGLLHSLAGGFNNGYTFSWGWNGLGQLGDGTTTDRNLAVVVQGLGNVDELSAGCYHSLAIKSSGKVTSWGWNALGQLGDGTTTDRRTAIEIPSPANGQKTVRIAAGCLHSLEVLRSGS